MLAWHSAGRPSRIRISFTQDASRITVLLGAPREGCALFSGHATRLAKVGEEGFEVDVELVEPLLDGGDLLRRARRLLLLEARGVLELGEVVQDRARDAVNGQLRLVVEDGGHDVE